MLINGDPHNNYYYWYVHDHLYSPVALVYFDGTVKERYEYDAYGNCDILEPNFADDEDGKSDYDNPYLFTGRRVDILNNGSLKLQYNRYRYYDPYTGRFTTHGPLGYADSMNLYEYALSRPIILTDPMGTITLGKKITALYAPRVLLIIPPVPWWRSLIVRVLPREHILHDDEGEMQPALETRHVKKVYVEIVKKAKEIPGFDLYCKWSTIPVSSGQKGFWRLYEHGLGGFEWWLGNSHYGVWVREGGSIKAHCSEVGGYDVCWVRSRNVKWEWRDEIDARSYKEQEIFKLLKNYWSSPSILPGFIWMIIEANWDFYADKIMGINFDVKVRWEDTGGKIEVLRERLPVDSR